MKKEIQLEQEMYAIFDLITKGKPKKALDSLCDLEAKNPENRAISLNKVVFLIDIGLGLKKSEIVEQGIATGEKLLRDPSYNDYKAHLYYNVANGYISLYKLEYNRDKSVEQLVDNKYLQKAKYYYREATKITNHLDLELRKQLWTNYGNCLDTLGRVMEALHAYDEALKIDPSFSMALGNKAEAIRFFADISGAYREAMYIKSYQMLKSALKSKDLVRFGGIASEKGFQDQIQKIETLFKDKNSLSRDLKHTRYDIRHGTVFEKFYIDFCSKYKLFLNFHIHEDECEASIEDPIFISLVTPIHDNQTFYNLAKHINQIKENYIIARLLLVQSQFKREDFNRISKKTTFVNTLDYSIFNIYVGLLKSAFKETHDILDKIAVFINEYYSIGLKERDVQFYSKKDTRCVWWEKKKIRKKILHSRNISLYALYDIFLDYDSNYYKKFQDIRNALVHRKLIVYDAALTNRGKEDDIPNIGYETMLSQTIELAQLVKSCIVYLINFVQVEEDKKRRGFTGLVAPMHVDTTQFL